MMPNWPKLATLAQKTLTLQGFSSVRVYRSQWSFLFERIIQMFKQGMARS